MDKKFLEKMQKMMELTFNDGFEQVVLPRLEDLKQELGGKIEESERRIKKELREEYKKGQQSLSNRLEDVERGMGQLNREMGQLNGKMDQVVLNDKDSKKRIDRLERVVKAN